MLLLVNALAMNQENRESKSLEAFGKKSHILFDALYTPYGMESIGCCIGKDPKTTQRKMGYFHLS